MKKPYSLTGGYGFLQMRIGDGSASAEVLYCRGKQTAVVIAGDIHVEAGAVALGMSHFAQNAAVGRGDALDTEHGTVRVERQVFCGVSVHIHVLGRDLSVSDQFAQELVTGYETSFSV